MSLAISADSVSKRYGPRWALSRVSFSLERGQAMMLAGHNGSGKTTLLRVLAGAFRPNHGRVTVLGFDVATHPDEVRRRTGLLTHQSSLYDDLTAEENLMVLARFCAVREPQRLVAAALARVGLGERARSVVRQFSAGMRKRLAIARLLIKGPELILLDEPFGELDPQGMADTEALINELKARGATIVVATHWLEQGRRLCDRELRLEQGKIEQGNIK